MSPLRGIARDLFERRLWPVAAVLLLGVIAAPVLLLHPAPAALEQSAAPAAPATTAAAPTAPVAAPTTDTSQSAGDPSVALTSSPFAAAFSSGLSLPPSMEGLLKSTRGTDERGAVAGAPLHDPFAHASSASSSPSTSTSSSSAGTSTASAHTAATTTASAPSAPATPRATTTPAPPVTTTSAVPATPVPGPTAPTSSPSSDTGARAAATRAIFHADVRFGTTASNPLVSDAKRLTAFPSALNPVAVFLGVMRGGWGAAFAIREGAEPIGAPSCRPRKQICSWVILHAGETVTLNEKDPTTGTVTAYQLTLDKIRKTTVTPQAATAAGQRVASTGRCLLGPLAAYRYDTQTGTLAPRPELKSCSYGTPARVTHIG